MKILERFLKIIVALCLALTALSVFAYFYDYHTLGNHSITHAAGAVYDPNSFASDLSEGYGWNRMDGFGFNNAKVIEHPTVVVMGGSHIQALQIPQRENVVGRLNERFGNDFAYNVGESGHYIDSLVYYLDGACSYFSPKYAVLDLNDLYPDEQDMKEILDGTRGETPLLSDKGAIIRDVRKYIPATGVLLIQLQNWLGKSSAGKAGGDSLYTPEYYSLRKKFFAYAAETAEKHGTQIILLYHPASYHVEKDGALVFTDSDQDYLKFSAMCDELGITVCSTKQETIDMYKHEHVLPNGFANTSLGSGHFNKYGHEAMADVLAGTITELEAQ